MTAPTRPPLRRTRPGFTLIELLVVVVIIGALAAIAVPKYGLIRERAARGTLMSDLRNLATAQEGYFFERRVYSTVADSLNFQGSWGVRLTIVEATGSGWSAKAEHPSFARTCSIHHGAATPVRPGASADQILCE